MTRKHKSEYSVDDAKREAGEANKESIPSVGRKLEIVERGQREWQKKNA